MNLKVLAILSVATLIVACSVKKQAINSANSTYTSQADTPANDLFYRKRTPYYVAHLAYKLDLFIPTSKVVTTKEHYEIAFRKLEKMLTGSEPIDFERAVYISENAFYNNSVKYEDYQKALDMHTARIKGLITANDKSDSMDFRTLANAKSRGHDYSSLRYTEQEKKELCRKALTNWAIYTYLTDTVRFDNKEHLPFTYKYDDPFGMSDWGNSQVLKLLGSSDRKGNCFALVALFKILSNRLNSEAYICTAPQHIYIQHKDIKGHFYNLELATGTYPGDGTLQTLTFTYREGIMSGISLRRLKTEMQNIALCMVNLGKSYEHKFLDKQNDYLLKCAESALKADSLNLNAMLLQKQVAEERVVEYLKAKNIGDPLLLNIHDSIYTTYAMLEKQILNLYDLGYHEMPRYMQEIVLAKFKKNNQPLYVSDRTPNPFTSIDVPKINKRYSTISGGLYEEVHEKREFEQYGQFIINTKVRRIVKFEPNCLNILIDPVVFAWSVDPMSHLRESWTPYNAFRNNPILNIDPTGALDTEYKDEDGNTLLSTNDGNTSTVVVTEKNRHSFEQWKSQSIRQGTLSNPENNMDIINKITDASKGVYFSNSDYGMKYIKRSSDADQVEYMGYKLNKGFWVEPTTGKDVSNDNKLATNGPSRAYPFTSIDNGKIVIAGITYQVQAMIHTHLSLNFFSGIPVDWRNTKGFEHLGVWLNDSDGDWYSFQGKYWYNKAGIDQYMMIGPNSTQKLTFDRTKVYQPLLKNGFGSWHDFKIETIK